MTDYFEYSEINQDQDSSVEEFVNRSLEAEKQRLEDSLSEVEELLEQRVELRESTLEELQSKLDWYIQRLEELYRRPGSQPDKRAVLKDRIEAFYTEIREEKRVSWRDRQELEAERRDLLDELSELEDTDPIFDLL